MKPFILILFQSVTIVGIAQSNLEETTENWLDSCFEENEINWKETENEFFRFAQSNFKKITDLESSFLALKNTASEKKPKKNRPLKTEGFDKLETFSERAGRLIGPFQTKLFDLLKTSDNFCSQHILNDYYLLLHETTYWSLSGLGMYSLTNRLISFEEKLSSTELFHKLVLLLLVNKIFHHYEFMPRDIKASIDRDAINLKLFRSSQDTENEENPLPDEVTIPSPDETDPCFIGGEIGLVTYIQNNVCYPEHARMLGIQGVVYTSFVVNADGSLSDISILKSPDDLLSKEAIRVIQNMPSWLPGIQAGKAVRIRYTIPIRFMIS